MMPQSTKLKEMIAVETTLAMSGTTTLRTHPLTDQHSESEILDFLAEYPVRTVVMSGLIRDNGLESPFNRGTFYACRDMDGQLQGVALIGHAMFIEARSQGALKAFARLAQKQKESHMILGEQEMVQRFWDYYSKDGQPMRLFCRELLFEQRWPVEVYQPTEGLRPATLDDLMLVMPVHAALAYEESGINPLDVDLQGFRLRCARRIEHGRVWILVERGNLVFKADVISDTPDCIYLEGIYVDPLERQKGYGLNCLSHLGRILLQHTKSVCGLINEQNYAARSLAAKAGYNLRGYYDTIFLQAKNNGQPSDSSGTSSETNG